jgi:hypothetical protein
MGRTYQARAKNTPSEWDAKEIDKIRSFGIWLAMPGLVPGIHVLAIPP